MASSSLPLTQRVQEATDDTLGLCYQCGACTAACPLRVPIRKLLRASQLGMDELCVSSAGLWNCAACRLCELACPRGVKILGAVHSLRVAGFERRATPAKLNEAAWGVYEDGNPWGGKKAERMAWARGLEGVSAQGQKKYLLYVGCASSYDPRLQNVARSLARVLAGAGMDFGVIGQDENCCGDALYQAGEEGYLEELIQGNIRAFDRSGAERVVTLSPHCLGMFRTVYPKYGKMVPAQHYTELLAELVETGKLAPRGQGRKTVTYHDPCYLGRHYGIYEEPRKVLESIPGVTLAEMEESKDNSLCCGGGGGLMWSEAVGERPSHARVLQAARTGASTLATSCPYCILNFEDAAKTSGLSGLGVFDICELILGQPGGGV